MTVLKSKVLLDLVSVIVILVAIITVIEASAGDRSFVYQKCLFNCQQVNCSGDGVRKFSNSQPLSHRLLQWSCVDECKYTCMWITVDAFQRDHLQVPQFHGKWPFVRWHGLQEPASVIFSILNGLAHLCVFRYRKFVVPSTPMYFIWHGAALTAVNAWFWSTVFHSKDTDLTEKMDYFCAFSIVLYNTFTLACRVFGTKRRWVPFIVGLCCSGFFLQHICYLTFNKFDYGYNMKVNISVALFNMVGWLSWCVWRRRRKYVWKAVASIVGIQMLLSLELLDFPPLWWTFDAHSLWHAGTPPLALLWYSFIIDDGQYLMIHKEEELLPVKID